MGFLFKNQGLVTILKILEKLSLRPKKSNAKSHLDTRGNEKGRSNVYKTEDKILNSIKEISSYIEPTMGPFGSNTIIQSPVTAHDITKDGYTVLGKIFIDDPLGQTILEYIRRLSLTLVRKVGDGSTSSVVTASRFGERMYDYLKERDDIPPSELLKALKIVSNYLINGIRQYSKDIDHTTKEGYDVMKDIAHVSTNGDNDISKLIADIYQIIGPEGHVQHYKGAKVSDEYTVKNSYTLAAGTIDPIFLRGEYEGDVPMATFGTDKDSSKLNVRVAVVEGILRLNRETNLQEILDECLQNEQAIVIIAQGYDENFYKTMVNIRKMNPKLKTVLIEYNLNRNFNRSILRDLAAYAYTEVIEEDEYGEKDALLHIDRLGGSPQVVVDMNRTTIFPLDTGAGEYNEFVEKRIADIDREIEETLTKNDQYVRDSEVRDLRVRKINLSMKSVMLYVGGETDEEKYNRAHLVDDAVRAVSSALKTGYIPAGNTLVPRILRGNKLASEMVLNIAENTVLSERDAMDIVNVCREAYNDWMKILLKPVLDNKRVWEKLIDNYPIKDSEEFLENGWSPFGYLMKIIIDDGQMIDLRKLEFEELHDTKIVTSTDTDIQIVTTVFNIIGLLITANQFITVPEHAMDARY